MSNRKQGIDYGRNLPCNRDSITDIRYGIIPFNDLGDWAHMEFEAQYPLPELFDDYNPDNPDEFDYPDCVEPSCFTLGGESEENDYFAIQNYDDCDVFIIRSPYVTFAKFCSPCAPGACYCKSWFDPIAESDNPNDWQSEFVPCYCFGLDWFDRYNPCPHSVWKIVRDESGAITNFELVYSPPEKND